MTDPNKPNVIFLLADNLGYGDVGCYGIGGEPRGMPTPNMDQLAKGAISLRSGVPAQDRSRNDD